MKKLMFLLALVATAVRAQVSFGHAEKMNADWLFVLADDSTYRSPSADDSRWRRLDLPHDWSIEGQLSPTLASCTGYLPGGIGWYRKHFIYHKSAEQPRQYVYFEGVYNRSEVYLNGHLLGVRPNGYASFCYEMTEFLHEGENVLAVRVDHSRYADSRWYTGSGIYRDVWTVSAPACHLAQWGTGYKATKLTDRQATLEVDVAVENVPAARGALKVRTELRDAAGKVVASAAKTVVAQQPKALLTLTVKNPRRWDLDSPYLYTLHTTLTEGGKVTDQNTLPVGLRTLEFTPDHGFALNGHNTKVKGVCLHHDLGP
ncbi:MAG: glycoside hydrolase family 2, partial [Bacteroidaceae bacterium]|nr:glycoside hydrolase family 2 [Bacteroidaceae bacterium]